MICIYHLAESNLAGCVAAARWRRLDIKTKHTGDKINSYPVIFRVDIHSKCWWFGLQTRLKYDKTIWIVLVSTGAPIKIILQLWMMKKQVKEDLTLNQQLFDCHLSARVVEFYSPCTVTMQMCRVVSVCCWIRGWVLNLKYLNGHYLPSIQTWWWEPPSWQQKPLDGNKLFPSEANIPGWNPLV